MSARTSIVTALTDKLKQISIANGFANDLYESVVSKNVFWDEVNQYPTICVVGGQEEREYLPSFIWGHYGVTIKLYVKDGDDPAVQLETLITDVEKVVKDNNTIEYAANKRAADIRVVTIRTDEGLLAPYGVAEVNISVQYQVL